MKTVKGCERQQGSREQWSGSKGLATCSCGQVKSCSLLFLKVDEPHTIMSRQYSIALPFSATLLSDNAPLLG